MIESQNLYDGGWRPDIDISQFQDKADYNNELMRQVIQGYNPAICDGETQSIIDNSPKIVDRTIELFGGFEEALLEI